MIYGDWMRVKIKDARTRLQRRRTRVRRGATRRRGRDAADRASVPRQAASATWFLFFFRRLAPTRLRLGLIRADLRRLGPYRPKSARWLVQAETADSGRNSNTLSHSVTRLSSLCSLRCACAWLHWITLRLSVSALRLGISTATQHKCYFHAWSSRLACGFSKKKYTNASLLARDKELQF